MLSSINVEILNNPYRGGVEIKSTAPVNAISRISNIKVFRKLNETGNREIIEMYTKEITTVNDLSFSLFDITAISGKSYVYYIDILNGNTIVETQEMDPIDCWFDGLFIGNFEKQYFAGTNYKVDPRRNTEVSYVTTLGSRVPYRVANANINYSSGSATGLFLKLTDDKKMFVPDHDHSYSTDVLDFLTDGTNKVLKTGEGQAWYVSIDDGAATPFNDRYDGMNAVNFSWTEIGDIPEFGMGVD